MDGGAGVGWVGESERGGDGGDVLTGFGDGKLLRINWQNPGLNYDVATT